jgi:hypothetical protein
MKTSVAMIVFPIAIALGGRPLEAAGASEPVRGYVQAGVMATAQPPGTPNHRVVPAISGSTIGLAAAGGVWLSRTVAVEGEFLGGRPVSTPQRFSYTWREDFIGESRDLIVGANVRWRPAGGVVELFGGGGIAISTVAERSIVETRMFPPRTATLPDQVDTAVNGTLNGGVALAVRAGSRIEVVPAFTFRVVQRPGTGLADYLGVGGFAYQFGATVRFKVG